MCRKYLMARNLHLGKLNWILIDCEQRCILAITNCLIRISKSCLTASAACSKTGLEERSFAPIHSGSKPLISYSQLRSERISYAFVA